MHVTIKIFVVTLLLQNISVHVKGQSDFEAVLSSIERNNTSLSAGRQYWEARNLQYRTGLTLPNPEIQYQYLFGSPETAGNQTELLATQSFDFPTAYKKRRMVADAQSASSQYLIAAQRQDVLLDAKLTCIELVWRNKLQKQFTRREQSLDALQRDFQRKLDQGEGNILDLNKVRLQLLELSQLMKENTIAVNALNTHLTEINGGEAITFSDTVYPPFQQTISFEQIEREFEAVDPVRQALEQEIAIAERQVELSQALRLPKFQAGYRYQGILGQRFHGIHTGITLPLWEHKNQMEFRKSEVLSGSLQLEDHRNAHYYEIRALYERQEALRASLDQYQIALAVISNTSLLDKALALGEITTIGYFLEMSFYQNALVHYLKTEEEYHSTIAKLYKYKL